MTTAANLSNRLGRNPRAKPDPATAPRDAWQEPRATARWLIGSILVQFASQLSLLFSLGPFRGVARAVSFGASLACLLMVPAGGLKHPIRPFALVVFALVFLELLHPETAGIIGGVAHVGMYLAILGPVFWVSRLKLDMKDFRRVMLLFWGYYALSAAVGMLQVYFPGRFEPDSQILASNAMREGLKITLASGERIYRPMGLTDAAGGAAMAGFYTCAVGSGLILERSRLWWRAIVLAGMITGIFVIYLSHVRSLLVMSIICMLGSAAALGMRGKPIKFLFYGIFIAAIFVVAWSLAVDVGGDSVRDRVGTLTASSARDVYYTNRGHFLESTVEELLPEYPLGAGLARWGMMAGYFGDFSWKSTPLYTEIQWTGWLLDGGIPMLLVYPLALFLNLSLALKVARGRLGANVPDLWIWGGAMVGYNLGTLAITFNAPVFMGGGGLEFWMLNTMLFVVATRGDRAPPQVDDAKSEAPQPSSMKSTMSRAM